MNTKNARITTIATFLLLATVSLVGQVIAYDDFDQDGLPDSWELQYFGDLSQGPGDDFDGDGFINLEEYEAGTDPTDPNDRPDPYRTDK